MLQIKLDERVRILQYPPYVEKIMNKLHSCGYQAWIVGGAVRDTLLGKTPDDYDIATSALPEEVEQLFDKTVATGKKHGTITVLTDGLSTEVTTLRAESKYSDNRRPDDVYFTEDIYQDLKRRDFTINAMAYNVEQGIIDPFNGRADLSNRLIRCVGNAKERFAEDALRLLRAVRFAVVIDGTIETETLKSIKEYSQNLSIVSQERISIEMLKMLEVTYPSKGIRLMFKTGLINTVLPEMMDAHGFSQQNPHHDKTVLEHTLSVLDCVENTPELRLAALLHDIGKPKTFSVDKKGIGHFYGHDKASAKIAEQVLKRWCQPKQRINHVCKLIANHMRTYGSYKATKVKKFIGEIGLEYLDDLFKLMVADKVGKKPPYDFTKIYQLKFMCERIIKHEEPIVISDLAINGHDLIDLGLKNKDIGLFLEKLLELVLHKPQLNKKDILIRQVKQWQQ